MHYLSVLWGKLSSGFFYRIGGITVMEAIQRFLGNLLFDKPETLTENIPLEVISSKSVSGARMVESDQPELIVEEEILEEVIDQTLFESIDEFADEGVDEITKNLKYMHAGVVNI
jgi:hypothetical protein